MDFKTRFQGKMQKISKDGGIDDMVLTSDKPINPLKKITIRSLHPEQEAEQNYLNQSHKITYGLQGSQENWKINGRQAEEMERANHYMATLPRQSHSVSQSQGMYSGYTQNIGQMIRKYFQNSQFIVVSLKEGLF